MEKIKFQLICFNFMFISIIQGYSQDFTRNIELTNPRMNGSDVKFIQNRLLHLGFHEIGEADGWYGPITKGAVEKMQAFLGFNPDGRIDETLWVLISNETKINFEEYYASIRKINSIKYELLDKSEIPLTDNPNMYGDLIIYKMDQEIKVGIIRYYGDLWNIQYTCYQPEEKKYVIVKKLYTGPTGTNHEEMTTGYECYYYTDYASYQIKEGIFITNEYDSLNIINLINEKK